MGNSGRIDFPTHMKTIHQSWLDQTGSDSIESSMVDAMNAALGSSPYASMTAYDPATPVGNMATAIGAFNTLIDALDHDDDWAGIVDTVVAKADAAVFDDTLINADIVAFGAQQDDRIENEVLPRFQAGMLNVNAVMSSAFVIGEAIIEGMNDRDVAKYASEARVKNNIQRNDFITKSVDLILRNMFGRIELEGKVAQLTVEKERMTIVAGKEKKDTENNITLGNSKWDLEIFHFGANLLSSIGGGTFIPNIQSPSTGASVLGGALSGAAIGSQIGGSTGAAVGAGIGGLIGGFS